MVLLAYGAGIRFTEVAEGDWAAGSRWLLGGTAAFSLATLCTLSLLGGVRSAWLFMAGALAISWLMEAVALQSHWLFGNYCYHPGLQPVLPGGVPLFIPLAWFSLAGIPAMMLRRFKTTRPDGRRARIRILAKSAWGATGLVACDLALDPICVSFGLWSWARPGPYFGVPWLNFAGWWTLAFLVFWAGYGLADLEHAEHARIPLAYDVAWGLTQIGLLLLMGVQARSRLGSLWPLVWSLLAMAPLGAGWIRSLRAKTIHGAQAIPAPIGRFVAAETNGH